MFLTAWLMVRLILDFSAKLKIQTLLLWLVGSSRTLVHQAEAMLVSLARVLPAVSTIALLALSIIVTFIHSGMCEILFLLRGERQ